MRYQFQVMLAPLNPIQPPTDGMLIMQIDSFLSIDKNMGSRNGDGMPDIDIRYKHAEMG
jgi:hypothetical protein